MTIQEIDPGTELAVPGILARTWPAGVPAAELARWRLLDADQRERAGKRLQALLSYERQGNWARRLVEAEMSRPGFFSMLRRWRAARSLASVVPGLRPHGGRGAGSQLDGGVVIAIARILEEHPDWPKARVIDHVRASLPNPPAVSTLRPLVDGARVARERERLGGSAALGRRVVVAVCPVELLASGRRGVGKGRETTVAHAGFAIDVATGHVLGHAAAGEGSTALRRAALHAARWVQSYAIDPKQEGDPPTVEVHLDRHGVDATQEARRLALVANVEAVRPVGNNSASRVVELLGPRLGAIAMRPRADAGTSMPRAEPAILEAIAARLDEEVDLREATLPRMLRTKVNVADLRTALLQVAG